MTFSFLQQPELRDNINIWYLVKESSSASEILWGSTYMYLNDIWVVENMGKCTLQAAEAVAQEWRKAKQR